MHKKYIRSLTNNFPHLIEGNYYYFGVPLTTKNIKIANQLGFSKEFNVGETIYPSSDYGKFSKFNVEGKKVINKTKGKEIYEYPIEWSWTECHGPNKIERAEIRYRSVERWHRDFIEAPELYLTIFLDSSGQKFILGEIFEYIRANELLMLHNVNLLLEIFGECDLFDQNCNLAIPAVRTYLNFEILPEGENPFSSERIKDIRQHAKLTATQRCFLQQRSDFFNTVPLPTTTYEGIKGLAGYYILEYKHKELLVVENLFYGNATYIFNNNIEISKFKGLTKKQIIDSNLAIDRVIHDNKDNHWSRTMRSYFS